MPSIIRNTNECIDYIPAPGLFFIIYSIQHSWEICLMLGKKFQRRTTILGVWKNYSSIIKIIGSWEWMPRWRLRWECLWGKYEFEKRNWEQDGSRPVVVLSVWWSCDMLGMCSSKCYRFRIRASGSPENIKMSWDLK